MANSKHIFEKGIIIGRKLSKIMEDNINYGLYIAYGLNRDDTGQCVVVKNKTIMAVESSEGHIDTIKRGCHLSNGKACVIITNKNNNDCISVDILHIMKEHKGVLLALEYGIVTDNMEEFIKYAKKYKIILYVFNKEEILNIANKED